MVRIQLVIGSKEGITFQEELDESKTQALSGLSVGDEFDGDLVGLKGYKLKITGGSDKQGFPMRKSFSGTARQKRIIKEGSGLRKKRKGERKRKSVRGKVVSEEIAQLNAKVIKEGKENIEKLLSQEAEEVTQEESEEKE